MKNRPLLSICLILSGILILWAIPHNEGRLREDPPGLARVIPEDTDVTVSGIVYKIIEKQSSNAVYLKDVQFLSPVDIEETQSSDSKSAKAKAVNVAAKTAISKSTDFLIYVSKETKIHIGNQLSACGPIHYYHLPDNPGNFNQKLYYLQQNIEAYILADQTIVSDSENSFYSENSIFKSMFSFAKDSLYSLRKRWSMLIDQNMSEENGSLLSAMLLGEKHGVDSELKELYQVNGIGHILAVSGLHISLIGISLYQFFRRTTGSYPIGGLAGILFMISYILMIGFSVSAARAFIMFLFRVGADITGRRYDTPTALGFSAFLLLLINPLYLYDGAFWFSYGAIVSILLVLPCFTEKRSQKYKKYDLAFLMKEKNRFTKEGREKIFIQLKNNLYEAFFASISIQILLLPVQAFFYYEVSPYSILLNLIVIPLMSVIMISGIIGSFLGILKIPGYHLSFAITEKIFRFYLFICKSTLKIPGARIITGQPKFWQIALYYVVILVLLLWYQRQKVSLRQEEELKEKKLEKMREQTGRIEEKELLGMGIRFMRELTMEDVEGEEIHSRSGLQSGSRFQVIRRLLFSGKSQIIRYSSQILLYVCILVIALIPIRGNPGLKLTVLDIGQGDCIYVESPDGLHMLVDGGSSSEKQISKYRIEPYLESMGVGRLDYVFVTHGDQDHINGINEMLDRKDVGVKITCLVFPPKTLWDESLNELAEKASEKGTTIACIKKGQKIKEKGFCMECLYPMESTEEAKNKNSINNEIQTGYYAQEPGNASSLVFHVSSGDLDILLTGDLEGEGEKDIIEILMSTKKDVTWEILKVAHHGSKNSTSEEFLDVVKPVHAVISAGENNRYGHPHKETIERLKEHGCKIVSTQERGAVSFEW